MTGWNQRLGSSFCQQELKDHKYRVRQENLQYLQNFAIVIKIVRIDLFSGESAAAGSEVYNRTMELVYY